MNLGISPLYQSILPMNKFGSINIDGRVKNNDNVLGLQEAKAFDETEKKDGWDKREGCQTCENRRYQDVSNDPGVSFKSPTKVTPEAAANAVKSHENEHVVNEQARAEKKGGKVISQSVAIFTSICPECKRSYVSGGETRTTVRYGSDGKVKADDTSYVGKTLDRVA